jgi:hypothetical protein
MRTVASEERSIVSKRGDKMRMAQQFSSEGTKTQLPLTRIFPRRFGFGLIILIT